MPPDALTRTILSAVAGLLLVVSAAARGPDFDFPAEVAGFARGPRTDYEARATGYGYSVAYTSGRWKADVYVYDGGRASIPDGSASKVVAEQLGLAGDEIAAMVAQGRYRGSEDRGALRLGGRGGRQLACRAFGIDHPALGPTESLLCITGLHGRFVKFRLSSPAGAQPSQAEAERFMTDWLGQQRNI